MKTIQTTIVIILISIFTFSCSKGEASDPAVVAPLQDPLAGYLEATGFNQKTINYVNDNSNEFGFSFIPLVNGKITTLIVKIPATQLGLRVTIWDSVLKTVLRTETIDVAIAGTEVSKEITALNLIKDKEYVISMNSNDWYRRSKTSGASVTYPFTVGDIKITAYSISNGSEQQYPNRPLSSNYSGDCSFKFQK